ncbi:MAG: Gldg family protein [Clostridia bacterium]|nr:Gldg family protein [Clostridia bacterium]
MKIKQLLNSRKFKYGSVAVVFSALFILVVIVANLIFTALDEKFNLKYDMTDQGVFTLTDATRDALEGTEGEVIIKFLQPIDKVGSDDLGKYIKECAESYAREFDNVRIEYIDMGRYPAQINKYRESGAILSTSVIVESSLRYKVIPIENFFVASQNMIVGFNGEMRFTSAILQVTNPVQPVVTFTKNHGETVAPTMVEVFTNAGYIVEQKDISREPLNPETKIIVISNPTTDFFGLNAAKEGNVSEIEILNEFMNNFGHVMVFMSPDNISSLTELDEFLALYGIKVNRGSKIKDMGAAVSSDGYAAVSEYTGQMFGKSLHKDIKGRTVMYNAAPIDILFTDRETDEETGAFVYKYDNIYVDPVLATTGQAVSADQNGNEIKGPFYTMAISSKFRYEDNIKKYSHLLVASTDYFSNFIGSNSYGNEKLLYNAMNIMGQEKTPDGIEYKLFDNTTLEKISQSAVSAWSWVLICIIPLLVSFAGVAVWLVRRHR